MSSELFELLKQLAEQEEIHDLDELTLTIFSDGSGSVKRTPWRGADQSFGNLFCFADESQLIRQLKESLSPKS